MLPKLVLLQNGKDLRYVSNIENQLFKSPFINQQNETVTR